MLDILTLIDRIIKQIRQLIQFFETKQETTIDEIESNVRRLMLEIGRLIIEWIIKSRGTGYTQRIISTPFWVYYPINYLMFIGYRFSTPNIWRGRQICVWIRKV